MEGLMFKNIKKAPRINDSTDFLRYDLYWVRTSDLHPVKMKLTTDNNLPSRIKTIVLKGYSDYNTYNFL